MTCIVAYKSANYIVIGGDSAGVSGLDITIRNDPKVFVNKPFVIGYTSSFRMGQILMDIKFPKQKPREDAFKYMRTTFVNTLRAQFKKLGYGKSAGDEGDEGGVFIVIYRGQIYQIDQDFQVSISAMPFESVGSGEAYAKGSMYNAHKDLGDAIYDPESICRQALECAAHFNAGVRPPFKFLKVKL